MTLLLTAAHPDASGPATAAAAAEVHLDPAELAASIAGTPEVREASAAPAALTERFMYMALYEAVLPAAWRAGLLPHLLLLLLLPGVLQ
jgi:hypothetical protein